MVKKLLSQVKQYKTASLMTPVFMVLEVLMETLIPYLMASMIDKGIENGDLPYIFKIGGMMLVLAAIGLWAGIMGGKNSGIAEHRLNEIKKIVEKYADTFSEQFRQHIGKRIDD